MYRKTGLLVGLWRTGKGILKRFVNIEDADIHYLGRLERLKKDEYD